MDDFLEKEKKLHNRVALVGATATSQAVQPPDMRAHGTKRRRQSKISTSLEKPTHRGKVLELLDLSNSDRSKE